MGTQLPLPPSFPRKGHSSRHSTFQPMSIVGRQFPISETAELLLQNRFRVEPFVKYSASINVGHVEWLLHCVFWLLCSATAAFIILSWPHRCTVFIWVNVHFKQKSQSNELHILWILPRPFEWDISVQIILLQLVWTTLSSPPIHCQIQATCHHAP